MVTAILIILIINLVATGILIELALRKPKTQQVTETHLVPTDKKAVPVAPDLEEESKKTLYELSKNIQTRWYDLEDDNDR